MLLHINGKFSFCSTFKSSNIAAVPAYGAYISHLIHIPELMISVIEVAANKEATEPRVPGCHVEVNRKV
jgi:hypothetical protein